MDDALVGQNGRSRTDRAEHLDSGARKSSRLAIAFIVPILLIEFMSLLLRARAKPFWYDELFTYYISSLRPFRHLFEALQAGVDSMPPAYHAIVVLARMLPGEAEVTLRLPSILGYLLALAGVYFFVTKRFPVAAGLSAMVLITLSQFRDYAIEARSYALLVGSLAIAAACWQRIGSTRYAMPLFAVFLTLAVACHHLGVLALSCFGAAEIVQTFFSRRIRRGVWAAGLIATFPFILDLPLILHFRDLYEPHFWSRPAWSDVYRTYLALLTVDPRLMLALILVFTLTAGDALVRAALSRNESRSQFNPAEVVLVCAFLYYPAFLVVLTKISRSGYTSRYGFPGTLGLALALVYLARSVWSRPAAPYVLGALLTVFGLHTVEDALATFNRPASTAMDPRWTSLAEAATAAPDSPVVIASPLAYLEAFKYAPPALQARLVNISDLDTSVRLLGWDTGDRNMRMLAQFIPLHTETPEQFQAGHPRFLLRAGGPGDWYTRYLVEERFNLKLVAGNAQIQVYDVVEH
jgi:hypothetical protein